LLEEHFARNSKTKEEVFKFGGYREEISPSLEVMGPGDGPRNNNQLLSVLPVWSSIKKASLEYTKNKLTN
jgi:hypothetical protein